MAIRDVTATFNLFISSSGDTYRSRAACNLVGEGSARFKLPFSEAELHRVVSDRSDLHRHLSVVLPSKNNLALGALDPQTFGSRLFRAVFTDGVASCFAKSVEAVQQISGRLIIQIDLSEASELAGLPWECLYDPDQRAFLSLSTSLGIVRYLPVLRPPSSMPIVAPPLNVLGVVANPTGVPTLDVEREWRHLEDAVAQMANPQLVRLYRLKHATIEALRQRLNESPIHLVHFIGHGYTTPSGQEQGLVLEAKDGAPEYVPAELLATRLGNHTSLRMVFLNTCEGGRSSDNDVLTGIAQQLIVNGVPSVLAMRRFITDTAAIILSKEFYTALTQGNAIGTALVKARNEVRVALPRDSFEWTTPILFTRAPDDRLLETTQSLVSIPRTRLLLEPPTVFIPGGEFLMGSQPGVDVPEGETPQHLITLPDYWIGVRPVTNGEYAQFIREAGRVVPAEALWNGQIPPRDRLDQPIQGVSLFDAISYCEWLSDKTGRRYRLPTEAEWEKAIAVAHLDNIAWGDVAEWTCSLWGEKLNQPDDQYRYPWCDDGRNDLAASIHIRRVIRGLINSTGSRRRTARAGAAPDRRGSPRARLAFRIVQEC